MLCPLQAVSRTAAPGRREGLTSSAPSGLLSCSSAAHQNLLSRQEPAAAGSRCRPGSPTGQRLDAALHFYQSCPLNV